MATSKKPTLNMLGKKTDQWWTIREERLRIEKEAKKLKAKETELYNYLVDNISLADHAEGVTGKLVSIKIDRSEVPVIEDEAKFRAYINRTKRFDLAASLKPATTAVREMWDAGKQVPGIGSGYVKKLKYSQVK